MTWLIAVDPGVTTGIVVLNEDGSLVKAMSEDSSQTLGWLQAMLSGDVKHVVYEQFRLYGGRTGASKSFSDLPEVRIIGSITTLCEMYGVKPASVPAGLYKSATAQWAVPLGVKGPHQKDAYHLGMWYHVIRLQAKATITLRGGRVYKVNEVVIDGIAGHKEVT